MRRRQEKLFVVRKYIKAASAADAIRKDRRHPVDEVWIDDEWKKGAAARLEDAIGFSQSRPESEDEDS
jgi:hypothetical protein